MKLKTTIICAAVSVSLVAGACYGAYYAMRGKKTPVPVVPVSNVSSGYWGFGNETSVYGTVTSQVSQTVTLNEEYSIDKIYVEVGDTVKEGDPLFAYDMTLPELELEMEQLSLQTKELELLKLQKDLENLKKTRVTASLESDDSVLTSAADVEEVLEEPSSVSGSGTTAGQSGSPESAGASGENDDSIQSDSSGENGTEGLSGTGKEEGGTGSQEGSGSSSQNGGLSVEGIETVDGTEAGEEEQRLAIVSSVSSYEQLMSMINVLFQTYEESLTAEDIGESLTDAVAYYRKHLAQEQTEEITEESGETVTVRSYVLTDEVCEALGEEETQKLEKYGELMDKYHARYVELLIAELDPENPGDFQSDVKVAREAYEELTTAMQAEVSNLERLEEREEQAAGLAETEVSETGTEAVGTGGSETGTEAVGTGGSETGTEAAGTGGSETGTEGSSETNAIAGPGTEGQTEAGTELANETVVEEQGGTETLDTAEPLKAQAESGTESESETETAYRIEVAGGYVDNIQESVDGNGETFHAGDHVLIHANEDDELQTFTGWKAVTVNEDGTENTVGITLTDAASQVTDFVMPVSNVQVTAQFDSDDEKIQKALDAFYGLADQALGVDGEIRTTFVVTDLQTAFEYYQTELSDQQDDIADGGAVLMEEYQLKTVVQDYLNRMNKSTEISYLENRYKTLCFTYVKTMIDNLDPQNLTWDAYNAAKTAYDNLGTAWGPELDNSVNGTVQPETPADGTESLNGQTGAAPETEAQTEAQSGEESGESELESESSSVPEDTSTLTYGERLEAYRVILLIADIDITQPETLLISQLTTARDAYLALNATQQAVVWNSGTLIALLQQYGLWETETETETEFPPFDDPGDFGDDGESYTASELQEAIKDKEREIADCELDIREEELRVKEKQHIVDGKIVKSTMDGTVISMGTEDGNSEEDYFARVANDSGLYARGVMNELSLETLHVGDTISGMMTDSGVSFTAVIKEVSQYPDPDGANMTMSFGTENSNASYYPFYALIDNPEEIEEGEAEIQFTDTVINHEDSIYLSPAFVRTENDGRSYVFIQGEDGKLTKRYVTAQKSSDGYSTEVLSGLENSDLIAFPYGKNVVEGAETAETDVLEY